MQISTNGIKQHKHKQITQGPPSSDRNRAARRGEMRWRQKGALGRGVVESCHKVQPRAHVLFHCSQEDTCCVCLYICTLYICSHVIMHRPLGPLVSKYEVNKGRAKHVSSSLCPAPSGAKRGSPGLGRQPSAARPRVPNMI